MAAKDKADARNLNHDRAVGSVIHYALAQFRKVTGLAVVLVPAAFPARPVWFGHQEDEFCRLVRALGKGDCLGCSQTQARLSRRLSRKLRPQSARCAAGLVQFAVPVVVEGKHVATVLGGKVRVQRGSGQEFRTILERLAAQNTPGARRDLRAAYFRPLTLTPVSLRHGVRLLDALVRIFSEALARYPAQAEEPEPPQVTRAKAYVGQHLGERLTTRHVAEVLHLNNSYFCRLFRRATGMTFRAYVAQARVKAAKARLLNTRSSITDICYISGFQSVSDFNRVFKARAGLSPSQFRRNAGRWLYGP